jgi:hypothetical protein
MLYAYVQWFDVIDIFFFCLFKLNRASVRFHRWTVGLRATAPVLQPSSSLRVQPCTAIKSRPFANRKPALPLVLSVSTAPWHLLPLSACPRHLTSSWGNETIRTGAAKPARFETCLRLRAAATRGEWGLLSTDERGNGPTAIILRVRDDDRPAVQVSQSAPPRSPPPPPPLPLLPSLTFRCRRRVAVSLPPYRLRPVSVFSVSLAYYAWSRAGRLARTVNGLGMPDHGSELGRDGRRRPARSQQLQYRLLSTTTTKVQYRFCEQGQGSC